MESLLSWAILFCVSHGWMVYTTVAAFLVALVVAGVVLYRARISRP